MLSIGHAQGREAFVGAVEAFVAAAETTDEYDLLGASRCHGWARLDVVTHVLAGWGELLGGLAARTGGPATVDAATYWTAFASLDEGDPVEVLLARRRRSDAYRGPASAVRELGDVGGTLRRICEDLPDGRHAFQGQVLTSGDLLATWAVETAVHHLDLLAGHPAPESALDLARRTCEALLGEPLPTGWADTDAVLVATGRVPVPDDGAALAGRLPVLG